MRYATVILLMLFGMVTPAVADWPGHWAKWDQLYPPDTYGAASWIDYDTPSDALTTDDFLCMITGYITDVRFAGWSYYGNSYIDSFRLTFWSDVPASPSDHSHPGTLLHEALVTPANVGDPNRIGWQDLGDGTFKINLDPSQWFYQQGTSANPIVYWIGIQGVMVNDGFFDAFYWNFRDRTYPTWGDDAAFTSDYFGNPPWANWGWQLPSGNPELYEGPLPAGWQSLDMTFVLTGFPEPTTFFLLAFGLPMALRRRR